MLVSIYAHCHCCIRSILSRVGSIGCLASLYLFAAVLLQVVRLAIAASLSLVSFDTTNTCLFSSIRWKSRTSTSILILTVWIGHSSLLPILVVLVFVWIVDYGTRLVDIYLLRRLDWCVWLVVVALMHGTAESVVHCWLITTALEAISQNVWVLLVRLVCWADHLWMPIRLLRSNPLSRINILRIGTALTSLYVLEVDRVLGRIDELWVSTYLRCSISTTCITGTLCLINVHTLARLLRCSSWCGGWVLPRLKSILWHIRHDTTV